MAKILVVCPSIYPEKYEIMLRSFNLTSFKDTEICFQPAFGATEAINYSFESNPDMDFYFIANDDIIFETQLWDLRLANKGKISYGNDSIINGMKCQFPMIDGDIARALGWLQLPQLERYCGDRVWEYIGKQCGILNYVPEVIIQHNWNGCSHPDIHTKDMSKFAEWLPWSFKDIKKVKEVLNGK